jgi:hypothetical protein
MVVRVSTVAFEGISALDIYVQMRMSHGIVRFNVVGLPDTRRAAKAASASISRSLEYRRLNLGR